MSVIRFQVDPDLTDEEIFERLLVLRGKVEKHGGPGPHKGTGTDQSVHGKGGPSYESNDAGTMPTAGPFGSVADILAMNEEAIDKDETDYPVEVQEAAADLLQTALYREAVLSPLVFDAAPGAKFKKPEYRVKLEPSIRSKIVRNQNELRLAGLDDSVEAAAEMVTDLNRYTILADDEHFLVTFESVVENLEAAGWESWDHKIKNYFAVRNDSFDGIVSKFRDSSGGIVEIQFHTTLSAEKQDLSHDIYSIARELPPGDPRRQELAQEMIKLWGTDDHVPPGVFDIGTPTEQIFKHAMHNQKDHNPHKGKILNWKRDEDGNQVAQAGGREFTIISYYGSRRGGGNRGTIKSYPYWQVMIEAEGKPDVYLDRLESEEEALIVAERWLERQ